MTLANDVCRYESFPSVVWQHPQWMCVWPERLQGVGLTEYHRWAREARRPCLPLRKWSVMCCLFPDGVRTHVMNAKLAFEETHLVHVQVHVFVIPNAQSSLALMHFFIF